MNENVKVKFQDLFPIFKETIDAGKTFSFYATGVSMRPYIIGGEDFVTLGPVTDKLYKNDIIFYKRENGQFVLHRIVKVKQEGQIILCGDNQFTLEKDISSEQILAKLIKIEKKNKTVFPEDFPSRLWCLFLPVRRFMLKTIFLMKVFVKRLIKKSS